MQSPYALSVRDDLTRIGRRRHDCARCHDGRRCWRVAAEEGMDVRLADGLVFGEGRLWASETAPCRHRAVAPTPPPSFGRLEVQRRAWAWAAAGRGTGWYRLQEPSWNRRRAFQNS